MYDISRPYGWEEISAERRTSILGRVLSLVGVAFLCTGIGAYIGTRLGPAAFLLSIVGSIGTLIALHFAREKSPTNLWLMYAFATFEGMAIGLIVNDYIVRGLGPAVMNAAPRPATMPKRFRRRIYTCLVPLQPHARVQATSISGDCRTCSMFDRASRATARSLSQRLRSRRGPRRWLEAHT